VHLLNAGHTFLCSSFVLSLFVTSFPSLLFLLFLFLFSSLLLSSFPGCLHVASSWFLQHIWLTHLIAYELPQIVPAHGTTPCGRIETNSAAVNIATHGMTYHQYLDSGKYSSSSTLKQFVHS